MHNSNSDGIENLSRLIKQRERRKENLNIETRISAYRMSAALQKKSSEEKEKKIDYVRNYSKEKKELNMDAVNDFFSLEIGDGGNLDPEDLDKQFYALQRATRQLINQLNKKK